MASDWQLGEQQPSAVVFRPLGWLGRRASQDWLVLMDAFQHEGHCLQLRMKALVQKKVCLDKFTILALPYVLSRANELNQASRSSDGRLHFFGECVCMYVLCVSHLEPWCCFASGVGHGWVYDFFLSSKSSPDVLQPQRRSTVLSITLQNPIMTAPLSISFSLKYQHVA